MPHQMYKDLIMESELTDGMCSTERLDSVVVSPKHQNIRYNHFNTIWNTQRTLAHETWHKIEHVIFLYSSAFFEISIFMIAQDHVISSSS